MNGAKNIKRQEDWYIKKNPDYETATMLLLEEHGKGNILATYELGDVYKKGIGTKINAKTAEHYYQRAFRGFEVQLKKLFKWRQKIKLRKLQIGKNALLWSGNRTE